MEFRHSGIFNHAVENSIRVFQRKTSSDLITNELNYFFFHFFFFILFFSDPEIPMIPLGLKETKEIDFREPFKDFILEHYSEDGADYENAIAEFMDIRQAMRTPTRDGNGIALLFEYFNQLYFVERRFFPPDRSLGIFFEW